MLIELFRQVIDRIDRGTTAAAGSRDKLKTFIRTSVASYAGSRALSRIILLEVRNSESFFASEAYGLVRQYSGMLANILQEGMEAGEFAPDLNVRAVREIIFGAIEHACLACLIFNREIDIDRVTGQLCRVLFNGIGQPGQQERQRSTT